MLQNDKRDTHKPSPSQALKAPKTCSFICIHAYLALNDSTDCNYFKYYL